MYSEPKIPGAISEKLGLGQNCSVGCELFVSSLTAGVALVVGVGKLNSVAGDVKDAQFLYKSAGNPFIALNLLQDPYNTFSLENIFYHTLLRKNYKDSVNNYGNSLKALASGELAALIVAAWNGYTYLKTGKKPGAEEDTSMLLPSLSIFPTVYSTNSTLYRNELNAQFSMTMRW